MSGVRFCCQGHSTEKGGIVESCEGQMLNSSTTWVKYNINTGICEHTRPGWSICCAATLLHKRSGRSVLPPSPLSCTLLRSSDASGTVTKPRILLQDPPCFDTPSWHTHDIVCNCLILDTDYWFASYGLIAEMELVIYGFILITEAVIWL
ncbi:hypothetical protein RJT34_23027 [Clitoria ternatea]|uniref:Uncharacterized protein n=1 Tax=Clitoria ternatea TaxID=43366 RepID=A0AAN9IKZ8_CLITE